MLTTAVSPHCISWHTSLMPLVADFSSSATCLFASRSRVGHLFPGTCVAICDRRWQVLSPNARTWRKPSVRRSDACGAKLNKATFEAASNRGARQRAGLSAVLEGLAELAAEKGEQDRYAVTGIVTVTDDGR